MRLPGRIFYSYILLYSCREALPRNSFLLSCHFFLYLKIRNFLVCHFEAFAKIRTSVFCLLQQPAVNFTAG